MSDGISTATLQCTATSVLSQDVISTSTITVDATSPSPVAPFYDPYSTAALGSPQIEALAIVNGGLVHARRNPATDGGWEAISPFPGQSAHEVAAGTAYALSASPRTVGFFQDGTTLWWTQLNDDGVTWTVPVALPTWASNLAVAYSHLGDVVLYGATQEGALLVAYLRGQQYVVDVVALGMVLSDGDFSLCMSDEATWWLAANIAATPYIFTGTLGTSTPSTSAPLTTLTGTLASVELAYYAASQNTVMLLLVDTSGHLHVSTLSSPDGGAVTQPVPNATVAAATGHVNQQDGTLDVFSLDSAGNLWVLHQSSGRPWNEDGTPNWAPFIALDSQVLAVASDLNPADSPTLFALDAATASLSLYSQDPSTQLWSTCALQQPAPTMAEVVRFRTEICVFDQYANPLPNQAVSVQVAPGGSAVDLWVSGSVYPVSATMPATLQTDAYGKVTVATLVTSAMAAPNLVVSAPALPTPSTVVPAGPVHSYLSGTGMLNPTNPNGPLPVFDSAGQTLAGAQVPGSPGTSLAPVASANPALAAVAAQAIQSTARVGLGQTPPDLVGYKVDVSDPSQPTYTPITSNEHLRAEVEILSAQAGAAAGLVGSFWGELEAWAGDLWEGIKNGVCALKTVVVDIANKVVTLAVQIGDAIASGITIALQGIEQAAHAVAGFFQVVGADLDNVVDWLKALFDFTAIWNTKEAFEQAFAGLPPIITGLVQDASTAVNTWFTDQKTSINNALSSIKQQYADKAFSDLPYFQTPGSPPDATTPVAGGATAADFNNNVHHNWLQDKVTAYSPGSSPLNPGNGIVTPWQAFVSSAEEAGTDFMAALKEFAQAMQILANDPLQMGTLGVADLIGATEGLVDSALSLCDALVQGFLALCDAGIAVIVELLSTELELGPLNAVWAWVAEAAGSSDTTLTLSAMLALMAAFPCTVVYKLIAGVDNEPFPGGVLPDGEGLIAGGLFPVMPFGCQLSAAILQIGYLLPAALGDYWGSTAPWYLTVSTVGLTIAMFVLQHGLPQLSAEEWGEILGTASGVVMTMPIIGFLLNGFREQLNRLGQLIAQSASDVMAMVSTLYGVVRFCFDMVDWVSDDIPVLTGVSGLLLPVPSGFAWLQMSAFRDDEEWAPIFQVASVVMDTIGYAGGGICQLVEVVLQQAGGPTLSEKEIGEIRHEL